MVLTETGSRAAAIHNPLHRSSANQYVGIHGGNALRNRQPRDPLTDYLMSESHRASRDRESR
jgi:hypothetical protein